VEKLSIAKPQRARDVIKRANAEERNADDAESERAMVAKSAAEASGRTST